MPSEEKVDNRGLNLNTDYLRRACRHTVMTPVAALIPASPNIAVAASVTNAVAPIFTTLST